MKAARIYEYKKPVVLEDIPIPDMGPDEILVQVKACGMCRSDAQLIDGYFRPFADIPTPITIGLEISGVVSKIGKNVPKIAGFDEGDAVGVAIERQNSFLDLAGCGKSIADRLRL